jgi:hypothetical protein
VDLVPLPEELAVARVDVHVQAARGLVGAHSLDHALPGEPLLLVDREDDQLGTGVAGAELRLPVGLGQRRALGDAWRGGGYGDVAGMGPVDPADGALRVRVHDEVSADDRETGERAVIAHVRGPVTVALDVAHDQLLTVAEADPAGHIGRLPSLRADRACSFGRRELLGRVALPCLCVGLRVLGRSLDVTVGGVRSGGHGRAHQCGDRRGRDQGREASSGWGTSHGWFSSEIGCRSGTWPE